MKRIISSRKSIIVAADVPNLSALADLAGATDVPGISAFKLGFTTGLQGLAAAVKIVKSTFGPEFPVIYDHQKAGTDIPGTGAEFANILKASGVDAAILFPFAGPATQEEWTHECLSSGLQVITGGVMTHPKFLVSEGGYIADVAVEQIYRNACKWGCQHFVVPGTKIAWVKRVREWLVEELGEGNFVLYAPGFIAQDGNISECGQAAGDEWHAIVGRAIYGKPTMDEQRQAAFAVASQIAGVPA